ncbi:MAG TPA: hypothetical protein VHI50_00705, partial [Micromonosporaceae bacterium]|nr:hypothetical protein [Micromonosporaceae bacterium]
MSLRRQFVDEDIEQDRTAEERGQGVDQRRPGGLGGHGDEPAAHRAAGEHEPPPAGQGDREVVGQHVVGREQVQPHRDREQRRRNHAGLPLRHQRVGHQPAVGREEAELQRQHRRAGVGLRPLRAAGYPFEGIEGNETEQCHQRSREPGERAGPHGVPEHGRDGLIALGEAGQQVQENVCRRDPAAERRDGLAGQRQSPTDPRREEMDRRQGDGDREGRPHRPGAAEVHSAARRWPRTPPSWHGAAPRSRPGVLLGRHAGV